MSYFFVEMTDTFGGEANYCWVKRFKVKAETMRGAVWKMSRHTGNAWHCVCNSGDFCRYDSASGSTCFFIEWFDPENHDKETFEGV